MQTETVTPTTYTHGPTIVSADRKWAMLCHLTALSFFIGIPFGHILGPLVIWLARRDQSDFVRMHGRDSINFQLTTTLIATILFAVGFMSFLMAVPWGRDFWRMDPMPVMSLGPILVAIALGMVLLLLFLLNVVLVIVNSIRAYDGHSARYFPVINFLK